MAVSLKRLINIIKIVLMVALQICVILLWTPAHAEALSANIIMNQVYVSAVNSFMVDATATLIDSVQFLNASLFVYIRRNLYHPETIPVFQISVCIYLIVSSTFPVKQRFLHTVLICVIMIHL